VQSGVCPLAQVRRVGVCGATLDVESVSMARVGRVENLELKLTA
jgi:hypothetical protein